MCDQQTVKIKFNFVSKAKKQVFGETMVVILNVTPPDYNEDSYSEEELNITKDSILLDQFNLNYAG